ncbi:hypothetical protein LP43_0833 [Methylophaga thiooxydans]|uniref:Uncharacterized protein n=1 Tax=Methylophaga thiooxydans TaxID=392484 RepID=A0A0A0BFF0_9GAMM|nr:hypothetical protein LP43_0833 [Methylophaga thiooxydans]
MLWSKPGKVPTSDHAFLTQRLTLGLRSKTAVTANWSEGESSMAMKQQVRI